jgi:transcriptional regulator with XRE-family HTH domain
MTGTPFGAYLRAQRVAAGLSLRQVADSLGVSHVYLGEVERGVRGPLARDRWPKLLMTVPGLSEAELERKAATTRPLQLTLSDSPPKYQDLGLALARRIQEQDLSQTELDKLLRILRGGGR